MKVKDLLNEGMKGYGPRYDDDQKIMFGAVSDWLEKMGVSKADLATAVATHEGAGGRWPPVCREACL